MKANRIRPERSAGLALALIWLTSMHRGIGAESVPVQKLVVTTNVVLTTNIVVVTNYVVTTNLAVSTNGRSTARARSPLPPVNWVPPDDGFDWIQLKSGEWLKGRLKAMQERELEFDSEELDDLTFDWKDIRQVRSPRHHDVLFVTGEKVSGSVWITPEQVTVGGAAPRVLPRNQLQSLTPGGSREWNYWSGKASLGLTLRAGNTEQVEYNAQARLQRRTPATRLSLDYLGYVSSVDGTESANNNRVNAEFDLWLSQRFYLLLPFVEYYTDPFQNLAHRVTLGTAQLGISRFGGIEPLVKIHLRH